MARGLAARQAAPGITQRLTALEQAIAAGAGRVDQPVLDQANATATRVAERAGLSAEYTVVALAGATGSGKSSVFNALAGAEVACVGIHRPTTSHPAAMVWATPDDHGGDGASQLLDWLQVPTRHTPAAGLAPAPGLVLLDLPDHDSVEVTHRVRADRLVERADLLVWVVDPQKYADAALHERYLRPLSGHAAAMVLALNQVDRLSPSDSDACLRDLERLARLDGLERVAVIGISAATGQGIEQVRDMLAAAAQRRQAATQRMTADLRAAARQLADACGPSPEQSSPGRADAALLDALEAAAGVPAVVAAVHGAAVRDALAATGWPVTKWLGKLRPDPLRRLGLRPRPGAGPADARLTRTCLPPAGPAVRAAANLAVRDYVWELTRDVPGAWASAARERGRSAAADLPDLLDQAVASTVQHAASTPVWWRVTRIVQWAILAIMAVGLGWLAVAGLSTFLRLPALPAPDVGGVALPTALAVGGALGGVLIALLSRAAAHVGARRRASRTRRRLREALARLAQDHIALPVLGELAALDQCRRAAQLAAS